MGIRYNFLRVYPLSWGTKSQTIKIYGLRRVGVGGNPMGMRRCNTGTAWGLGFMWEICGFGMDCMQGPQSWYAYAFSFASVYAINTINHNGFRRLLLADVVIYNYCYYGSLSVRFNGHFPGGPGLAGTRMSPVWILLELRMMEVVITAGAMRCANLQSKCHHQQTNM